MENIKNPQRFANYTCAQQMVVNFLALGYGASAWVRVCVKGVGHPKPSPGHTVSPKRLSIVMEKACARSFSTN